MYHRAFWPILHGIPCVAFPEISWAPLWRYPRYIPGTSEVPGVHSGYLWGSPLFLIPVRGQTLQIDTSIIPIESETIFSWTITVKVFFNLQFCELLINTFPKYSKIQKELLEGFDILSFPTKNMSLWCTIPSESNKIVFICSILNHFNIWIEEKLKFHPIERYVGKIKLKLNWQAGLCCHLTCAFAHLITTTS